MMILDVHKGTMPVDSHRHQRNTSCCHVDLTWRRGQLTIFCCNNTSNDGGASIKAGFASRRNSSNQQHVEQKRRFAFFKFANTVSSK
jgi:hypothetical protein